MIEPCKVNMPSGQIPEFPLDLVLPNAVSRAFVIDIDGEVKEVEDKGCVLVPTFHMDNPRELKKKLVLYVVNLGLEIRQKDCFVNPVMNDYKQGFAVLNAKPA